MKRPVSTKRSVRTTVIFRYRRERIVVEVIRRRLQPIEQTCLRQQERSGADRKHGLRLGWLSLHPRQRGRGAFHRLHVSAGNHRHVRLRTIGQGELRLHRNAARRANRIPIETDYMNAEQPMPSGCREYLRRPREGRATPRLATRGRRPSDAARGAAHWVVRAPGGEVGRKRRLYMNRPRFTSHATPQRD
jgi:hypothetical protein